MAEAGGTFFGLIVKPTKRYDTVVKEAFRVTKACLEPTSGTEKVTSLYVEYDSEEYIIANLDKKTLNENLDLGFSVGEKISFKVEGPGTVHLTGNIVEDEPDFMDGMDMGEEEESEEDESPMTAAEAKAAVKSMKRKVQDQNTASKKAKVEAAPVNGKGGDSSSDDDSDDDDDDDDDDDSSSEMTGGDTTLGDLDDTENFAAEEESDDSDDDDDDDEDDDSDDSDDSDEEEAVQKPTLNGKAKDAAKQTPAKKEEKSPKKEAKTPKEDMKTPKKDVKVQEAKTPKQEAKTPKQDSKTPKQDAKTPKESKTPKQDMKTPKQEAKTPKEGKTPKEAKTPKLDSSAVATPKSAKKTLKGGIQIEEIKEGSGAECKPGSQVGMFYSGRLKSNNKQFDSCLTGKPFKFKLGKGEVIKGWDIGIVGLKVGGKRRLTIPPNMAYGAAGSPPVIPGNSTLVFEVECKYVN